MKARITLDVETDDEGAFLAMIVDGDRHELPAHKPASRQLGQALASAAAKVVERDREGR